MVRIEEADYEYTKPSFSKFIGVNYNKKHSKWGTIRWSKNEKKTVANGTYDDEETAAHASDTLARKLIANGEKGHKLNFPDDDTEVYPEVKFSSKFIGVSYKKTNSKWKAYRWSQKLFMVVTNGFYEDEEKAAHASDILARNLIENGERHKLNFPDDETEVCPEVRLNKRKRKDEEPAEQEAEKKQMKGGEEKKPTTYSCRSIYRVLAQEEFEILLEKQDDVKRQFLSVRQTKRKTPEDEEPLSHMPSLTKNDPPEK